MTDANITDPFADHNDEVDPIEYVKSKFHTAEGEVDWNSVAKGKLESDKHISNLEKELAELRKKAEQGMAVKDLLEAIKSNRLDGTEPPVQPKDKEDPPAQQPDIEEVVRNALNKTEQERREAVNKDIVVSKLYEVWGDKVAIELKKTASGLGVSVKELEEMGKKSPQALFKLLGVDAPVRAPSGTQVPTSTVNLGSTHRGVRNQTYYNELRKSNPKLYNDPKTQAQELRDAMELGEAFFT